MNTKTDEETKLDYSIELIIGAIGVIIAIVVFFSSTSKETALLIGIISLILPICIVSIKLHIRDVIEKTIKNISKGIGCANQIAHIISTLPQENYNYAIKILNHTLGKLKQVEDGVIPLSDGEYFEMVIDETRKLEENSISYAVNVIDERRFEKDPREKRYLNENIVAVNERKVNFHKIFVYDGSKIDTELGLERLRVIKNIKDNNIKVSIVFRERLVAKDHLFKDWVMFDIESDSPKLFLDCEDKADPLRVLNGEFHLNESKIESFKRKFSKLQKLTISDQELENMLKKVENN